MIKKSIYSIFISFIVVLFTSCNFFNTTDVHEYFEYWSETVTLNRYEVESSHFVKNGTPNIEARDSVKIDIYLTNPKLYDLELGNISSPYFSVFDSGNNDVTVSSRASLSSDKTIISLNLGLSDSTEKQDLSIKGYFYVIKGQEKFKTEYSYDFRQNTSPDIPGNLRNPSTAENDGYHCIHFNYPDPSLNRNQNLAYIVNCYLFENGLYTYIDSKTLTAADSKSNTDFTYYFSRQEKSLQYDYVVTAITQDGLKSKTISTAPALGVCYVTEPELELSGNAKYNDNEIINNEIKYDVVEYAGANASCTAVNTSLNSRMEVKLNGNAVSNTMVLPDGYNTIEITITKNLCRPITKTFRLFVQKSIIEPELTFFSNNANVPETGDAENAQYSSANGYECYNINLTNGGTGLLEYTVTSHTGETASLKINDADKNNTGNLEIGPHTFKLTVTKPNCETKIFTRKIYVQGILRNPEISFTGNPDGIDASGNQLYRFSYMTYDEMPVTVSPGNTGNTMTVKVNGTTKNTSFDLAPDGTYTITVLQNRQYCKTPAQFTKTVAVKIIPITLSMQATDNGELAGWITGFEASSFDVKGTILLNDNKIFSYGNGKFGVSTGCWCTLKDTDYSYSQTFNSPDDTITIRFDSFRRHKAAASDKQFGDHSVTNKISYIKTGKNNGNEADAGTNWTFICDTIRGTDGNVRPRVKFTASE